MTVTTYLYVSSANTPELDKSDVTIQVPEDSLRCDTDSFIRLTLAQFSIIHEMQNVTLGHNVIKLYYPDDFQREQPEVYTLTPGNYRLVDLEDAFNSFAMGVTIRYIRVQNRWEFRNTKTTSTDRVVLTFDGDLRFLFGFRQGLPYANVHANSTSLSDTQVQPRTVNDICVHLSGIQVGPPVNVGNVASNLTDTNTTTVAGVIPLRAAPGTMEVFQNVNDVCTCQLYDTDVQKLQIRVTDLAGRHIPSLPNWTAVFRVDVHKRPTEDPVLGALQGILEYMRLFVLRLAVAESD